MALATITIKTTSGMDILSRMHDRPGLVARLLARALLCIMGIGAIAWGSFVFPIFWQQIRLDRLAAEYVQGHALPMRSLLDESRRAAAAERTAVCNPVTLHDIVILRLAIVEEAMQQANAHLISSGYSPIDDAIRKALACAPTDSAAWLILFWQDVIKRRGAQTDTMNYLRLSYGLGPNEGWIALWRNRLAIAMFEQLPDDLKDDALREFVGLLDTERLYAETILIFGQATPSVRARIVQRLEHVPGVPRQIFATVLYDKGLAQGIPGAWMADAKAWNTKHVDAKLPSIETAHGQP
jgi:hypothetical protein